MIENNPYKGGPLGIMLGTLDMMGDDGFRSNALTTEVEGIVIDTVCPTDTRRWETGIQPVGKSWIIVEQYPDEQTARLGHEKWVASVTADPTQEFIDVFYQDMGFDDGMDDWDEED